MRPPLRRWTLSTGLLAMAATAPALANVDPHGGMLRNPDISRQSIVFSYANDLWIVDRDGGVASPLASPAGAEGRPRFSPDGKTIAFEGNYDGGRDIYTISADGGIPSRVTHHPTGETLCDWTPDGDLLFHAAGLAGLGPLPKLYTVSAEGGLPEVLPLPFGTVGALHEDGEWLAYTPHTRDHRTWKRYRGGMATDIWLFNLETNESRQITEWEGTDSQPMWAGDTLYYMSDDGESSRLNIWSYELESGDREQVTFFDDYDVKWPAIGPGRRKGGEIIFQNGSGLHVLNLRNGRTREVDITIPGDRPSLRTRRVNVRDYVTGGGISATGQRAVVSARGDIWTLPAENGSPRNLTRSVGSHERTPAWSPDGRWIAYFSDATGEYELYMTQSDGKGETTQLTHDTATFYFDTQWSPDSKYISYADKAGRILLYDIEGEETRVVDQSIYVSGNGGPTVSWSHDSRWMTYARGDAGRQTGAVWIYNVEEDSHQQVTSGMFNDSNPTFDRKGKYLFFSSTRQFSPTYSGLDSTFIYQNGEVMVAVPLKADHESPWLLESDEETWDDESAEEDADEDGDDEGDDEEAGADDGDDSEATDEDASDDNDEDAAPASPIAGRWEGNLSGLSAMGAPPEMDTVPFTMNIQVADDGTITGSSAVMGESEDFDEITFDEASGAFVASSNDQGVDSVMKGTLDGDALSGTWTVSGVMDGSGTWDATRAGGGDDDEDADEKDDEAAETVEIDFDGFEERAFQLPVSAGLFGQIAVNHRNHVLYVRGGPGGGIKVFDVDDREGGEKSVGAGNGFALSGDGKKILLQSRTGGSIQNAGAGGSGKPVVTNGMIAEIEPRTEWEQILREAWRIYRDFFYVENMHGVDWDGVYDQYEAMLADCVTREDVSYVIREMISELNVGHAYYFGGDTESQPRENVGMLGIDFEVADGAYRIAKIVRGAKWDLDARGPLSAAGLGINEGDYLLAVGGVPLDTDKDPWAAFVGTAGQEVMLTVSASPELDEDALDVVVKPSGSERSMRYRAWIEHNRRYVEEATDGQIGYIYVPDTGVNGQNDLFRQFYGQQNKKGLIIDERWNGGGQIPTRFIELLNRPVTNYWAVRDGEDWTWPPDSIQGPKCMLINGLAGSGGDMFPWLFRHNELGALIGTRTWGGLVGISGNPALIDGGYCSVPTFGFYEVDGTWGIEGHGVDPDIEVVADPALMVDGGDPQLDAAIEHMLEQIKTNGYVRPARPESPDRSGVGVTEDDK